EHNVLRELNLVPARQPPPAERNVLRELNIARAPAPDPLAPTGEPLSTPLRHNRFITRGYIRIAQTLQGLLDPDFHPGGTSHVRPCWFAFAPHASQEAGKGMLGAAIARRIIDLAQGETLPSAAHAYDRVGLTGPMREGAEKLSGALGWHGLPRDAAAAIGALGGAMNLEPLSDPRTLWSTAHRIARLFFQAPGFLPLDKAEALARTLEGMLHEGNVAIFSDIGGSAQAYLGWRQDAGASPRTACCASSACATPRPSRRSAPTTSSSPAPARGPRRPTSRACCPTCPAPASWSPASRSPRRPARPPVAPRARRSSPSPTTASPGASSTMRCSPPSPRPCARPPRCPAPS
ncbi:hypothetical protein ACLESD_48405, partial [Pyxidicoccus sp. 3LFB2]